MILEQKWNLQAEFCDLILTVGQEGRRKSNKKKTLILIGNCQTGNLRNKSGSMVFNLKKNHYLKTAVF
jgi:hypothetical protein